MKKIILIFLILLVENLSILLYAQERTIELVKNEVYSFFTSDSIIASRGFTPDLYKSNIQTTSITKGNTTYMYVVNMPDSGWAIVSNEQRYPTIIGYSMGSHFDTNQDNQPEALRMLLEHHMNMIDTLRKSPSTFYDRVASPSPLTHSIGESQRTLDYVLLKRNGEENRWKQSRNNDSGTYNCNKVYNKFCPTWYNTDTICHKTIAGCVAVALAQVLWYWHWPDYVIMYEAINMAGTPYGETSRHYYDWDNMPTTIYNTTSTYQVDMVAGLLRDCGYAAHTLYESDASESIPTKLTYALEHYYNFHVNPRFEYAWTDIGPILQDEIYHQRPVICQAGEMGSLNGHTFVIDGYNSATNKYHINWGWGYIDNGMWDLGFNGYTSTRTFFTELYPDCTVREASVSGLDINTITSGSDVTLYSANNVSLNQLIVANGGHLNISAGNKILLNAGFVAQQGSMVKLSTNYVCSTGTSTAPVSAPMRRNDMEKRNIFKVIDINAIPNPATDEITILCDVPIEMVSLFNINGSKVLQTSQIHIDISHLSKGIYIIRATTDRGLIIQSKLIHE